MRPAETTGYPNAKNQSGHRTYTFYKSWLKMDHKTKCETQKYKTPRR